MGFVGGLSINVFHICIIDIFKRCNTMMLITVTTNKMDRLFLKTRYILGEILKGRARLRKQAHTNTKPCKCKMRHNSDH